jgi:hypothetical protein
MYRYTSLLSEEHARLERARESRTVRPLGRQIFAVYGRQLAMLIVRSWDRADRVHAAMLSRGFDGGWPTMQWRRFRFFDGAFIAVSTLLFLCPLLLAHDLYLLPKKFVVQPNTQVQVVFHNGDNFPKSQNAQRVDRMLEPRALPPSGAVPLENLRVEGSVLLSEAKAVTGICAWLNAARKLA